MHLISALAAGVAGAENGTCVITKRGTSTKATYYTDFEGTTAKAQSVSSELGLDANGRLVAYVDEVVDIVCKSSGGVIVATFTDGASSPAMEVRSPSFTGTDYVTAASAAGSPTTLQAVLDLWKTNAGSIDWKVQGVTPTQLFNQTYTLVFNVKNYGATGDGSTDDTSFISAAITAAAVSGGVVFFPPGTYRVTSVLTISEDVSLVGGSGETTAILMDHASNELINTSGSSSYEGNVIEGLRLAASVSNSGIVIDLQGSPNIKIRNCFIGSANNTAAQIINVGTSTQRVMIDSCTLQTGATASSNLISVGNTSGSAETIATRCKFLIPSSYNSTILVCSGRTQVHHCDFNASGLAVVAPIYIELNSTAEQVIATGNAFRNPSSGTATAFFGHSTPAIVCSGNRFGGANVTAYNSISESSVLESRTLRRTLVTDNSSSVALDSVNFGAVVLRRTVNGAQTLTAQTPHLGARLVLMVENATGGAMTAPTLSGTNFRANGTVQPANGEADCRLFVAEEFGSGSRRWAQIGSHIDITI